MVAYSLLIMYLKKLHFLTGIYSLNIFEILGLSLSNTDSDC